MLNSRNDGGIETMRSETNISSLAPGFAGERAGVRGPNFQAIPPLTPNPFPEYSERGAKIVVVRLGETLGRG